MDGKHQCKSTHCFMAQGMFGADLGRNALVRAAKPFAPAILLLAFGGQIHNVAHDLAPLTRQAPSQTASQTVAEAGALVACSDLADPPADAAALRAPMVMIRVAVPAAPGHARA